jgi:hypothetical protein
MRRFSNIYHAKRLLTAVVAMALQQKLRFCALCGKVF